ncbi:type III-A CRISPR-associated RAMP protein Csm5 [Anoxybacter fermentans]|uniref:CRISPR system Cms protein Csm5 n=1 Tax=Anoxybacter fermentans TaxID=1323375 RepID=A0A3Q9HP09_9FIRM|nr:type III-A CRISPR-associated RAMP protein Csm5 [Anoxybacter fermentans]AZR72425.1 type III-A CRISPR-associated RAMP protein Csm5 [Anoxybacter fermentans]
MNLVLEILTPMHIGNGDVLSPYSDYIYKDGQIYYINHQKLEDFIFKLDNASSLIDKFVDIIKKQASGNQSSKYKLENFFEANNLDIKEFTDKIVDCNTDIKNKQILKCIYTGSRPYIPGSTLKGAIRTSLIYGYLKRNSYNLNEIISIWKQNKYSYIGQDIFGKFSRDIMKFLQVSDTEPFSDTDIEIIETYRVDIESGKTKNPVVFECLKRNLSTKFSMTSKGKKNYHHLEDDFDYLYEQNEAVIFDYINDFFEDAIKREISELKSKYKGKGENPFLNIISFYEQLLNEIMEFKQNKNGAVLRIGAGKTFFENTINNIFSKNEFEEIKKIKKIKNNNPFPKTRTVVVDCEIIKNSLGWIKIYKEE